ncbi:hypothetical protein B0T16DRAFT_517379 [Cercophora newfieldiana]|uniref:Uncharacterized protein n=1 Tax=Cercophora newfieldiana TaxID=92897 RepID=A0AA40CHT7_9PEZI|nr:hypothetical protein B0T16DRAFT_517379 [Cercophora newfieldiana]
MGGPQVIAASRDPWAKPRVPKTRCRVAGTRQTTSSKLLGDGRSGEPADGETRRLLALAAQNERQWKTVRAVVDLWVKPKDHPFHIASFPMLKVHSAAYAIAASRFVHSGADVQRTLEASNVSQVRAPARRGAQQAQAQGLSMLSNQHREATPANRKVPLIARKRRGPEYADSGSLNERDDLHASPGSGQSGHRATSSTPGRPHTGRPMVLGAESSSFRV